MRYGAAAGADRPERRELRQPPRPIAAKYWSSKDGEVYVKVAKPSKYAGRYPSQKRTAVESWRPERLVNFKRVHGPVPRGLQVPRLLPLCNCEENLVLITPAVGALLNKGQRTGPFKPWREPTASSG